MTTILQLTDTHLSPRNGLFRDNLDRLRRFAEDARPDLVIVTGDLSLDGADQPEDLALAMRLLRAFPAPLLCIPGNHDTGSHIHTMPRQPVSSARVARFRAEVGADHWLRDLPGWRLVGLNTEVLGTGLPEEAAQAAFLAAAAAGAGARRIALFLHKPAFVTEPADPTFDYWSVPPAARASLSPLLDHPGLRLVASGHLHLHHEAMRGPVRYAWAPPVSFIVEPEDQPGLPGTRPTGALLHRLGDDAAETQLIAPPGMASIWMASVRDQTYPRA